jgi:uncharacterized protein
MNTLIVDGYNIIHAWPRLKAALRDRGLEDARRLLVQTLAEYSAHTGVSVTLVFDAHSRHIGEPTSEVIDGVLVRFGTKHATADHVIERTAYEAARRGEAAAVTVATDDRLQRDMVRAMGIATTSAQALNEEVSRVAASVAATSGRRLAETVRARRVENQLDPKVLQRLEALRLDAGGRVEEAMSDHEQTAHSQPEQEVAWTAVKAHAPVIASDGKPVGKVLEVAALPEEDIFHGIVFQPGSHPVLAPAASVARITDRAVYLSIDNAAVASLEEFHSLHVERLGVRGLFFWKHLGWKDSSE